MRYSVLACLFILSALLVKLRYFRDRKYRDASWILLFCLVKYQLSSIYDLKDWYCISLLTRRCLQPSPGLKYKIIGILIELYENLSASVFLISSIVILYSNSRPAILSYIFLPNFLSIVLRCLFGVLSSHSREGSFSFVIFKTSARFLVYLTIFLCTCKVAKVFDDVNWTSLMIPLFMIVAILASFTLVVTIYFLYRLFRVAVGCKAECDGFTLAAWLWVNVGALTAGVLLLVIKIPRVGDGKEPPEQSFLPIMVALGVCVFLGAYTAILHKRL